MNSIKKKLIAALVCFLFYIELYAKSSKSHGSGESFFLALMAIVFFVGMGKHFLSEMHRKNGDYGSGMSAHNAQQNRLLFVIFKIAPIMIILFLLSKACN